MDYSTSTIGSMRLFGEGSVHFELIRRKVE